MTAHVWLRVIGDAGEYMFKDLYEDDFKNEALSALLRVTTTLLKATSAVDTPVRDDTDKLKVEIVEALCLCEVVLPSTELNILFHVMLHIPDMIYRWNLVRNFWCYFGER
jgi:hypothetical protein